MADVFVSYKSENRKRVQRLVAALRRAGISVWWDQDIPPNAPWEDAIHEALRSASCVLVCWTKASVDSRQGQKVQVEARAALEGGKLIQVLLDPVEPPLFFRQNQAANLCGWRDEPDHAAFQKLAQAIKDISDGRIPASLETTRRRQRAWLGLGIAAAIASLITIATLLVVLNPPLQGRITHTLNAAAGDPVVIGIYPSDAFGPLHRYGLHAAMAPYERELRVIDLEAPYAEMKAGEADALLDRLRELILHENVVAIVGPPVTELTGRIVREVERSGMPVPVFITSSSTREAAGWEETRVPLFRINSGVDERAAEFVDLARQAVAAEIPLVFLVETTTEGNEPTYGQILFQAIASAIPEWEQWVENGYVTRRNFQRGEIAAEMIRWNGEEFLDRRQLLMLLGAGKDYTTLVQSYYRSNQKSRRTVVGGWMNAYNTESVYVRDNYQWSQMFEVTDIDFSVRNDPPRIGRFRREFGPITPALRDQAFSFDAGSVVGDTLLQMFDRPSDFNKLKTDAAFLARYSSALSQQRYLGVTGRIRFDARGQNVGGSTAGLMVYAQYSANGGWRPLSAGAILALVR